MWQVSESDLKSVLQTLTISEEDFLTKVTDVSQWQNAQDKFPEVMDVKTIQNFLILNKGDVTKTKQKIQAYYNVKLKVKNIFDDINPKLPYLQTVTDALYFVPLPKLTEDKYRVTVLKIKNPRLADHVHITDALKYIANIHEVRLKEDIMFGDVCIFDTEGASLRFCLKFTPRILYTTLVTFYEKVFSSRLKAGYLINPHPILYQIFILIKKVMKTKLASRLHVLKDPSMLKKYIPEDILPSDFGGTEQSLEELQESIKLGLSERQQMFDHLDALRDKQIRMANMKY